MSSASNPSALARHTSLLAFTVATLALAACSSASDDAERQYAIVKKSGDAAAVCAHGAVVAAAYLKAEDAERYTRRKTETDIECQKARDDEARGDFRMPDGSLKHIEADRL